MRIGSFVQGLTAATLFTWSAGEALRPDISRQEVAVFRWFNDGPDIIETPVRALTQAGSLGSVFMTAAVVQRRRGARDALLVLSVGTAVWIAAKLVKPAIGRGRPDRYIDVRIRGRPQSGLGYPSGHAAVATALALVTARTPRSRPLSIAVASMVGGGRMYMGAHLPLDVAGGFAIGAGTALAAEAIRSATSH